MKSLFFGILLIILLGVGGLVYRNAAEHPMMPIACPLDARVCPDGTSVGRTGLSCTFPECSPPNISLSEIGIAFAIPAGFFVTPPPDASSVAAYALSASTTPAGGLPPAEIVIRRFAVTASTTALDVIRQTAIGGASGAPVGITAFSSADFGVHRFTVVSIERFEGVVDTAYYLARANDVLRFDAIDRGVVRWTDPELDVTKLPAAAALEKLLVTLEVR